MAQPEDIHLRSEFPQADFPNSSSEAIIRICPNDLMPASFTGKELKFDTHLQVHQQGAGTCPKHLSSTSDYGASVALFSWLDVYSDGNYASACLVQYHNSLDSDRG